MVNVINCLSLGKPVKKNTSGHTGLLGKVTENKFTATWNIERKLNYIKEQDVKTRNLLTVEKILFHRGCR